MPALAKPHRIAFLAPDLTIEGIEAAYEAEAALLLWTTCIEICRRHPGLAVYDPESTPLFPQDGHFAPQFAALGATPDDAFFAPTRRDELLWLELTLPKGLVRLHAMARGGKRESFDALGRSVGEQLQQVFAAWLGARGLGALPKRDQLPGSVTADEVLSIVRILGPVLGEQARAWTLPVAVSPAAVADEDEVDVPVDETPTLAGDPDADIDAALDAIVEHPSSEVTPNEPKPAKPSRAKQIARMTANRLPPGLRVPALRVLELALREDLTDLISALDPEHPGVLFAKFLLGKPKKPNFALLRRVIAASPGWARPYGELIGSDDVSPISPTDLETVAGAGMAALCRPAHREVVDTAADHLRDDGRIDEAVRLIARAMLHDQEPYAHISLLHLHRSTDRIGAWLEQAHRSASVHGCPMDSRLPWYPDQIQIDLLVADALMNAGRLDEAIALRANRLEGREATWPRHAKILTTWRKDPRFVARCYAREGWFRGDPARTVEGFGRIEPDDGVDLAIFLDALVAMGREDEVALAWGHFGLGRRLGAPVARLAAARGLMAAGEWRRGLEEMWRVELTEPGRDEHVAIARCGLLLSIMPIDVAEAALGERMASGAHTLARRMARDIADFVPGAAKSSIVMRALGMTAKPTLAEFDPASLAGFAPKPRGADAIDALFAELEPEPDLNERHAAAAGRRAARRGTKVERSQPIPVDPLVTADRLVNRWLDLVFASAGEDEPAGLAQAAAYVAAHALGRYLAATTATPSVIAGALRTVAGEALALVRRHQESLADREARALLGALEPLLRRVDRWVGTSWLSTVERACFIDERAAGDVAGFTRELATVSARILGPEEVAVLSVSITRLHRDRADGWESAAAAQAARLALHTGHAGVAEWADAIAAQLAARRIDLDDAVDALSTACYLAEGKSAVPCVQAARVLLGAGRAPAAFAVLSSGLAAAGSAWRDRELATLAQPWKLAGLEVPFAFDEVAAGIFQALQKRDPARAEKLGRWAVARDPNNAEAHRNLGLALAQQGKVVDAMHHLVRGSREQATQILSGVLYQSGKLVEAMGVLDYASRWYVRAEQWLTYAGIAYSAMDNPRTVKSYALAYQLDPEAFDATQLNAYAGVLDEVGDYAACEKVANHLLRVAGDDVMWKTNGWNHLACAFIGLGKFDEAITLAQQAIDQNPLPDNTAGFAATLERAKTKTKTTAPPLPPPGRPREPAFELLEAGDFTAAAALGSDKSWRVRRAALAATRFRYATENAVEVTPRARAAAAAALADTVGSLDRDAVLCREIALAVREQTYFARDPVPRLGDRMTRDAFYREFRARGGVVLGEDAPKPAPFVDRVVVAGAKVARASDYVALLRDLAALAPREALAQFDLDDAGYLEVAKAWAAAIEADPSVAATIAAGLAKR
jgi:tetratricopeptide (TPR) repeat protein